MIRSLAEYMILKLKYTAATAESYVPANIRKHCMLEIGSWRLGLPTLLRNRTITLEIGRCSPGEWFDPLGEAISNIRPGRNDDLPIFGAFQHVTWHHCTHHRHLIADFRMGSLGGAKFCLWGRMGYMFWSGSFTSKYGLAAMAQHNNSCFPYSPTGQRRHLLHGSTTTCFFSFQEIYG